MKKWLFLPLVCMLSSDLLAAEFVPDCNKMEFAPSVPAVARQGARNNCLRAALSLKCDKAANEKKMVGKARSDFMIQCEGYPATPVRKSTNR